jgi:hypothetical protein
MTQQDTSKEFARLVRDAEVGEVMPEETPVEVGNLSGGELNNGPVPPTKK